MHLAISRPALAALPKAILPAGQSASLARTRQVPHRVFVTIIVLLASLQGQTASTGALTGVAIDPSGRALVGVVLHLTNEATGEVEVTTSDEAGRFGFLLLSPGLYDIQADANGFARLHLAGTNVTITEMRRLELHLRVAGIPENIHVSSEPQLVRTESSALGRVVNQTAITGLPLVTRNFAQIAGLSPGVATGVFNAGEIGLGGTALSQIGASNDGIFVHGTRSYANNWQLDGISVSDVQSHGSGSGGIPVPNPDAIEEFKVQTALYNAEYGRYAGGNISVTTKTGSNTYHGTIFEFFRNDVLNANDFFFKQAGRSRPALRQNQFGFALGGPDQEGQSVLLWLVPGNATGERAGHWSAENCLYSHAQLATVNK